EVICPFGQLRRGDRHRRERRLDVDAASGQMRGRASGAKPGRRSRRGGRDGGRAGSRSGTRMAECEAQGEGQAKGQSQSRGEEARRTGGARRERAQGAALTDAGCAGAGVAVPLIAGAATPMSGWSIACEVSTTPAPLLPL